MPEFEDRRDRLQQARIQKEQARLDLFHSQERIKKIKAEQTLLEQVFSPNNPEHLAHRQQLDSLQTSLEEEVNQGQALYDRSKIFERESFVAFTPHTDPREQVNQLSDAYPFLLLPVRLETRFKSVTVEDRTQNQLWVRVYPDDCAIDTFEATLSEAEVKNARTYWADRWRAGGFEDQHRGAWRGLVASHGSGRAAWIEQQYRPLNLTSEPRKVASTDIILVIETETPLSDGEQTATAAYWRAVWLANGDRTLENTARLALDNAVGSDQADEITQQYKPLNLEETPRVPLKKTDVAVSVAFVVFPQLEDVATKQLSWSQAPKVNVLPDRFVLMGYINNEEVLVEIGNPIPLPLIVGPDPSVSAEDQLKPEKETGDLTVGEDMKWMVDFERAIEVGMGFKIDLNNAQATRGFDRLLVLGLRLSADQQESKTLLETLIQHHHNGRSGFSLLPQGTPTNNTERNGAGFSRADDADTSFDDNFLKANQGPGADSLFAEIDDPLLKRDGQWLAEFLGIDTDVLKKVRHSDGTDQSEAKAMNIALWPATLGYMMDTMMRPVFTEDTIESTRWFFNRFVSGRGSIPAVRIGSQPYGILPTTVFSRMRWLFADESPVFGIAEVAGGDRRFLSRLYEILRLVDNDWAELVKEVSHVGNPLDALGKPADAHKILLDILGLHSGSVEYYQRYAESSDDLLNRLILAGEDAPELFAKGLIERGMALLRKLGYRGREVPDVLKKFFLPSQNLLKGPVIDDRPLSEIDLIRVYTPDNRNYIQWLIDAANTSLDTLNQETGFTDNKSPTALLYILLRYALTQGYWDTSIRAHLNAEIISAQELASVYREPNFIHIKEQIETSESRWQYLYKTEPRITNNNSLLMSDYITRGIGELFEARYLTEQIEALKRLDIPTARLERVFAEHIDCCTYRLDAWWLGLVHYQLASMRNRSGREEGGTAKGLYLGAYGWLENVRPENKPLSSVQLEPELNDIFNKNAKTPLLKDGSNEGYIHAPSLNHAVTAAVLRNGYLSNATPKNPQTLAVNLSSQRVRLALSILEGIRNGQSLSALLGYQLERGLHDHHNLAEVDQFIYKLRKAFPLRADRFNTTKTPDDVSIEAIEARNVVDGLSLINHIKRTKNKIYPFGKPELLLPRGSAPQEAAINTEVDQILDIHDAVADLAMAEGVHQAVQGNYDRAAATLDTYSKGNFPPEPDVVQTPRSGITLTHRVGLHLQPGLTAAPTATPRAQAEPALSQWLAGIMPLPAQVACKVAYYNPATNEPVRDPGTNKPITQTVTQQNLQLEPIDWLYLLRTDSQPAMTELDDRILLYVTQTFSPRPDIILKIQYTERLTAKISFFELAPMMQSLRSLVLRSRPLKANDIALHNKATKAQEEMVFGDRQRIDVPLSNLTSLKTDIESFKSILETLFQDVDTNRTQILANVDSHIATAIDLLSKASRFSIPQTGWGFALEWKQRTFSELLDKVRDLVNRWRERLNQFDILLNQYNVLPGTATDQERFDLLQQAERLVSTSITNPLPASPNGLRTLILAKRSTFSNKLTDFGGILTTTITAIATLYTTIEGFLPITDFDLAEFQLTDIEKQIILFTTDLSTLINSLSKEVDRRLQAVQAQLVLYEASTQSTLQVQALQDGAKALLGEEFQLIPEFEITPDQGDEWGKSWSDSRSGVLTNYLTGTVGIDFPIDDWLYGAARVREKMHHWEHLVMLTGAFGRTEPELQPIQLPYKAKDHWLALQFPYDPDPDPTIKKDPNKNYQFDGDRLLYTAHYAIPFQKNQRQCGLLLDEWTEVIPSDTETTGIAFHYDRPNCEPPQTMLLVTPPDFTGNWQWQDLVDALNETLDMAKKRAVEPEHVDSTPYARFLPSTIMAVTLYQISIAANLALNNKVLDILTRETP